MPCSSISRFNIVKTSDIKMLIYNSTYPHQNSNRFFKKLNLQAENSYTKSQE